MDMYAFRDRVLHDPLPACPRADVPAWLVAELHTAMAKVPAQRHASALEFSQAIQRGALGMPAPAAAPPVVTRTAPHAGQVLPQGIPAQAWPQPLGEAGEPDGDLAAEPAMASAASPPTTESPWAAPPRAVPHPTSPAPAGASGPGNTSGPGNASGLPTVNGLGDGARRLASRGQAVHGPTAAYHASCLPAPACAGPKPRPQAGAPADPVRRHHGETAARREAGRDRAGGHAGDARPCSSWCSSRRRWPVS